jgi:hypothetical protein
MASHPEWRRTALSQELCRLWNWRNGAGRLKDMAARTLLLKLEARGLLQLPPRLTYKNPQPKPRARPAPAPFQLPLALASPPPIVGSLSSVQPVHLALVDSLPQRRHVARLLSAYHYRGFGGAVGENVQYVATDPQGRELALLVFGAAAWKVAARDEFIGWSAAQRAQGLPLLANQQRFLILPWVRVPHLASHLLALATRRLAADWQGRYGHRIWLLETFVETQRFSGAAYRAAGWQRLGVTTGRTRQDRENKIHTPVKDVWVYALDPHFRHYLYPL